MPSPRPSPGERAPSFERADRDERFRDADPARCRATGRASWPKPAPHPRLAHGRARRAARRRRPVRGARSRPPLHRAPARRARVRALLRQLDAHQVGVGRGRGPPRHAAGDRGWRLDPGRARGDGRGDGGGAGHERARARHPSRPDPRRGQPLHGGREAGDRRLPRRDERSAPGAGREPPARRRPPAPDARRPHVAPAALPRRAPGQEDRGELGLFAELRQAALGPAGSGDAAHPLRRRGGARAPGGLPAHRGRARDRANARRALRRQLPRHLVDGGRVHGRRRGVPQELGPVRPDARSRRREPRSRRREDGRDRAEGARAKRGTSRLDLRRATHGAHPERACALPPLPARRHRRRGLAGRHGGAADERGAPGEQEALRGHGAAGDRACARPRRAAPGARAMTPSAITTTLDARIAALAARDLPLAVRILKEAIRIPADHVDRPEPLGGGPAGGLSNHARARLEYLRRTMLEIGAVRAPDDVRFDAFGNLEWVLEDPEDDTPRAEKRVVYWDGHCDTVRALRDVWHAKTGGLDPYLGLVDPAKLDRTNLRRELGWLPPDAEWDHLVFGRGAADQLGGVVSQIVASRILVETLAEGSLHGVIVRGYITVAEEDNDGGGPLFITRSVLPGAAPDRIPDVVILTDSTGDARKGALGIYRGQRGRMQIEVKLTGRSCHGSMPWEGLTPLEWGAALLVEPAARYHAGEGFAQHEFLGPGTRTASWAQLETPSDCAVPDRFTFRFDRRLKVGEPPEGAVADIESLDAVREARAAGLTGELSGPRYEQPTRRRAAPGHPQSSTGWGRPPAGSRSSCRCRATSSRPGAATCPTIRRSTWAGSRPRSTPRSPQPWPPGAGPFRRTSPAAPPRGARCGGSRAGPDRK